MVNENLLINCSNLSSTDANELTIKLISAALANECSEVGLLNNIVEYRTAKILLSAQKKIIKGFKLSAKMCYKKYLVTLKSGTDNLQLISDLKVFEICRKFYTEEAKRIMDVIDEFEFYMIKGHLLEMLSGAERPYKDMHDSRKKQK